MTHANLSQLVKDCLVPVKIFVRVDDTVEQAVMFLREKQVKENFHYVLAIDEENHLKGIVPTRLLILKEPNKKVSEIMETKFIKVRENETLETALELLNEYKLLSLPVVDNKGKLLGAIDIRTYMEESLDLINKSYAHDLFSLFGVTIEEGKKGGVFKRFSVRLPWTMCNMVGGIFCAIISRIYEDVLAQMLVLAMFIPLVLTLSESISMQSMTQSLQHLRKDRIGFKRMMKNCLIEWKTVGLLSLTSAVLVGSISLFWGDGIDGAIVIGVGLLVGIFVSAFFGSVIPYILHRRNLDPKVAAGPIVLMFADVFTTAFYLTFATLKLL